MNNKIKAGIYTILVFLLIALIGFVASKYPQAILSALLIIALGGLIYAVYKLIYTYLRDEEEEPFIF
jgi:energy-coupling factor transporter transmembrane protein EcfT